MIARRPQPPPAPPPVGDGELDGRLRQGQIERLRKQAVGHRFQERVQQAAKAKGDDPYELLAKAIKQMLRGE